MDRTDKYYEIIENIVKQHKKYPGNEAVLEDIIDDVYSHSEVVINSINNENVINTYLSKVVSTSIITVPKKLGIHRAASVTPAQAPQVSEQSANKTLVDRMINELPADNPENYLGDWLNEEAKEPDFVQMEQESAAQPEEVIEQEMLQPFFANGTTETFSVLEAFETAAEYDTVESDEIEAPFETDKKSDNPVDDLYEINAYQPEQVDIADTASADSDAEDEDIEIMPDLSETGFDKTEITFTAEDDESVEILNLSQTEDNFNRTDELNNTEIGINEPQSNESAEILNLSQTEDETALPEVSAGEAVLNSIDEDTEDLTEISELSADGDSFELQPLDDGTEIDALADLGNGSEEMLVSDDFAELDDSRDMTLSEDSFQTEELSLESSDIPLADPESEETAVFTSVDYTKFDYTPDNKEDEYIDAESLLKEIKTLDGKRQDLNIMQVYNLKYKENCTIPQISLRLGMSEDNIIEALNELTGIV